MSLGYLINHITAILSIVVVVFVLSKWRNPRTLFFTCYTLCTAVFAVGYLLEVTAPGEAAAIIACKVQYFGVPYIAPSFFLFCLDYSNAPIRRKPLVVALLVLPIAFTVLVNTWPQQHLFYSDLTFVAGSFVNHLVVSPGPLYPVSLVYNAVLLLSGVGLMLHNARKNRSFSRRHIVIFLASLSFLAAAQFIYLFRAAGGWDPMPTALTLNAAVLAWYIVQYRQSEWAGMSREMVMEQLNDAFILVDDAGRLLDANAAAHQLFPDLPGGRSGAKMKDIPGFPMQLLAGGEDSEFTIETTEGTKYLRVSRSRLEVKGRSIGTSLLIYDNTETHHLLDELQQLATHDALTGLFNRGTFFRYSTRDYELCLRKKEAGSVLMMDIDHFKQVNDLHGHAAGDTVLVSIAGILRARLRHTDISGRYGGEELAVWLPGAASEGAFLIADVIRRAVEHTPYESEQGRFHVTISIGVAGLDHERHQSFDQLVAEADEALYQAKRTGRNKVCLYQHTSPPSTTCSGAATIDPA